MKASPFPPAPLQAIRAHESGVVVITNPPNALEILVSMVREDPSVPEIQLRGNELTMV